MAGDRRESGGWTRLRRFLAPRARTWGLMVPIHLIAFTVLYLATSRIMERQILDFASETAKERLDAANAELLAVARAHPGDMAEGHIFGALLQAYRPIELRLFLPEGRMLDEPAPVERVEEMSAFLASGEGERFRVDEAGQRVRALRRIVADRSCAPCHELGKTLAVTSMTLDLSGTLGRIEAEARGNLLLLIVAWAALVGMTTTLVKQSARRAADRLQAELAAAETGDARDQGDTGLVLDPVSARLHSSVREFIQRRRKHEEEVASRLEHTDQLASLGRLAAGLAHEIKNPLAGIQGALEILREDMAEQESVRTLCGDMLEELERVNGTLQLLLTGAKPSAPQLVETDLRAFVTDIRRLLEPGLGRRGIDLAVEIEVGDLSARMDRTKIRQALVNLVQNAADAVDEGGRILIRVGSFPDRRGVIFTVEDDGPGISEENLKRIFEPFYTTKFSGTGLGLTIARSLVEQHEGSLEVQSEAGVGTSFLLLLPQMEPHSEPASDDPRLGGGS